MWTEEEGGCSMNTIWVSWSFIGFHRYPTAPIAVEYLASPHRHTFNVRVELQVDPQADRELEFHMVLATLKPAFHTMVNDQDTGSCEAMCKCLQDICRTQYPNRFVSCTVDEDGECGSTIRAPNR